jgi:hypothetical protein
MKTIEELHEKERKKFHHKRKLEDAKKLHSDVREYNYRLSQKELYSENCSDAFKK